MTKTQRRWTRIIKTFASRTVGVLGDYMLDEFWRGQATRISPEAPVPVLLLDGSNCSECYPGGAGNVAANVAALGGGPVAWGVIGSDETGRRLLELLGQRGIRHETLLQETGRMTPRKVRLVAHQHQLLRLDFERPAALSAESREHLVHSFRRYVSRLDALIVSDYQKGSVTAELCDQLLPLARDRRLPVFVDPKPANLSVCRSATAVTPNLREAEVMAGHPMRDAKQIERAGRLLLKKFQCGHLLITRSSEGMILFTAADGARHNIPGIPRPVYDVTGAGDTVIAVLALAYCSGASMKEAAELANLAAGRVVLKFGTSQISGRELLQAVRET